MRDEKQFEEVSYHSHDLSIEQFGKDGEHSDYAGNWLNSGTVEAWRQNRIYETVSPLIDPDSSWLTVGDGRYGLDAQYLSSRGCNSTASDISGVLLKEAHEDGLLSSYSVENAESLSFDKNSFDYVLCKDAYHHFPRPMCALYEMLRVAREGVILIEPSDHKLEGSPIDTVVSFLETTIRKIFRKPVDLNKLYEVSGNYVYRLSRREIEKVALGLNYSVVAFKGISDFYQHDMLFEMVNENGPYLRRAKIFINFLNLLARIGLRDYRLLSAVIFKNEISDKLQQKLLNANYTVIELTRNPYT